MEVLKGVDKLTQQKLFYLFIFILVNLGILYLLAIYVPEFAKTHEKSGKNYSDQLLRYQDKEGP